MFIMADPFTMKHIHNKGFTLIEMIVVVALVAILSSLAGPAFTQLMAKNRIKNISSDLHVTMLKARSEAVKANANITITPTGGNWKSGWAMTDAGGNTLQKREAANVKIHTTFAGNVVFLGSGRPQTSTGLSFTVYEDPSILKKERDRRCVSVGLSGLPTVREDKCTGHTLP